MSEIGVSLQAMLNLELPGLRAIQILTELKMFLNRPKIHKEAIILTPNECFICMETCQDQIKLNCNHTMCNNCITECMKRKDTCPFCRTKITDIYTYVSIFALKYQIMKENKREINQAIIEEFWHPKRIIRLIKQGFEVEEIYGFYGF